MNPDLVIIIIVVIMSAVVHEFFHGRVAYALGDPTAKHLGRLTLNPIPHLDMVGSILLPLVLVLTGSSFIIGWAKPVPYNPYNLRDQRWGNTKVALAGPAANMIIALLFGLTLRFADLPSGVFEFFVIIVFFNILLAAFNLIPIPPLDGSKIIMDLFPRTAYAFAQIGFLGIFVALIIGWSVLPVIVPNLFYLITGIAI